MELTSEDVIYQFDMTDDELVVNVIWRGVPLKRFRIAVELEQAAELRDWLIKALD